MQHWSLLSQLLSEQFQRLSQLFLQQFELPVMMLKKLQRLSLNYLSYLHM
jgi:hypothetical protein